MSYEAVIGLEIHAELNTRTKMFCDSLNDPDEKHPNVNICPVCMGHPGTLPVANREAIKKMIQIGLALGGEIAAFSQFDRKNYFYPDLPKGYQISQYEHPIVRGGVLDIGGKQIRIQRVHLEEDTGRLVHSTNLADWRRPNAEERGNILCASASSQRESATLVDFNRAGVPLMELVTEPDFRTGEEVRKFGEEFQLILRTIGASHADMEKGEMRVEANVSIRKEGETVLGTKIEVKNINSFKFAEDAVNYEIKRQQEILEGGGEIKQATRGWDEKKRATVHQRFKEESHDYRYFPEPDLPPLEISQGEIEEARASLPELPAQKRGRFQNEYGIDEKLVGVLVRDGALADYFEKAVSELAAWDTKEKSGVRLLANYLTSDFLKLLNEVSASAGDTRVTPENFAELVHYIHDGKISSAAAKSVLKEMFATGEEPDVIIEQKKLWQVSDEAQLASFVDKALSQNPEAVAEFAKGKGATLQFLVGQVMKEARGAANPQVVAKLLKEKLS
ncbi:MAG: Asp-tRNA(Asn)/Glu-tRNA(Gln) amidotransferase subunit GatB [bacterium]|nr:Asp-tRNA(Asn)/Glu-tRNA(Gln) amidotransferase subunit GatB [bacterium]